MNYTDLLHLQISWSEKFMTMLDKIWTEVYLVPQQLLLNLHYK